MDTSLGLQILLYLNIYYYGMFGITEILLAFFKWFNLPYPTGTLIWEGFLILLLSAVESMRLFLGQKANLTESSMILFVSLSLLVPSVLGVCYVLLWQTYVLRLEMILASIQLTFHGLEFLFSLLCLLPMRTHTA